MNTSQVSVPAKAGSVSILKTVISGVSDPEVVFRTLVARGAEGVLLESGDGPEGQPSKSLVIHRSAAKLEARGSAVRLLPCLDRGREVVDALADYAVRSGGVRAADDPLELRFTFPRDEPEEQRRLYAPNVLEVLRAALRLGIRGVDPAEATLLAGVFAYDLIEQFEPLPAAKEDPSEFPDYVFWVPEGVVRIDHDLRTTTIYEHVFESGEHSKSEAAIRAAEGRLAETKRRLEALEPFAPKPPEPSRMRSGASVPSDTSDAEYEAQVRVMQEAIRAGEVFQVVPSRVFRLPCADARRSYTELRRLNPSPYMFLIEDASFTLFGASPEAAIRIEAEDSRRTLRITPIAGTRPRARRRDGMIDPETDARVEAELRLDEKENAEHMMLVDLARNDVARVCRPGSRYVAQLLTVVRYAHVMHLVSEVQGDLREGIDALHAYQATLNMGTLVGAPKVRAAQLIRELEGDRRGPYGGAVSVFFGDGRLDSAIVIRSALVKNGEAQIRAGAGVVFDSDPRSEADETRHKARSVCEAIERAEGRS